MTIELASLLQALINSEKTAPGILSDLALSNSGNDPWSLDCRFLHEQVGECRIRSLTMDDARHLVSFANILGTQSKELFCPYPWSSPIELEGALIKACRNSVARIDASYLLFASDIPVAHFFLWKASTNELSRRFNVEVPELGIAVADRYHGLGLGGICVTFLKMIGRVLMRDAIELTTDPSNHSGYRLYERSGFEQCGEILNPLEVDVTAAASGEVAAAKFRMERQMVHLLNESSRSNVDRYLAFKRSLAAQTAIDSANTQA